MRRLALLTLVVLTVGCANHRHVAVVASGSLYQALSDVHALEQTALCGQPSCAGVPTNPTVPGWTAAKSQAFNQKLLPAVEGGRQYNTLLAAWKPGQPLPVQIHDTITGITAALTAVVADFPEGTTKTKILAGIGTAQAVALQVLDIVLTVQGGQ